jgi:hypothetical protein
MSPEGHYNRRREEQDRIINEYLEFMRKKDEEAKKEKAVAKHFRAYSSLGIKIFLNLN